MLHTQMSIRQRTLARRTFLRLLASTGAGAALAGCRLITAPEQPSARATPPAQQTTALPKMQRTAINGVQLEVRDSGAGEPVVFVHGAMGDECAAVLSEPVLANHYRLIDYHRRGWGNSERLAAPLSIEQQAADCRAVMQHFGVARAHLVGQSYGGVILLQMALDTPDAVHTLSLLEPALPSILFNSLAFGAVMTKAASLFESGDKAGAMDAFGQEVAGADYRTVFDQTLPPGYFERWVVDGPTFFRYDGPALQPWTFTRERAVQITQPVLNMRGVNTQPYFRACFETIQTWLPQAENFVLPKAPHTMLQSNPSGAAERLARFFASHPLPG
jgi:pimeloyl-ACP methyl ester carboxylesterase